MLKNVHFGPSVLPFLLVLPQIVVTLVFFIWPASQALYQSVLIEDPFGLKTEFVWFRNFEELFRDPLYWSSFEITVVFSFLVAFLSMSFALESPAEWQRSHGACRYGICLEAGSL